MNNTFWRPSDEQRRTILLMEVAGLLHDLGKLSNGFIKKSASDTPTGFSYDYQLIADPNIVFPPVTETVSKTVNELQKKATSINRQSLFKDRTNITIYLQSQSFQSWNFESYNLAEVLLGQFASQDLVSIVQKSFEPANLLRELHRIAHYEKEDTDRNNNNQPHMSMYTSSPFGVETLINIDSPGNDLNHSLNSLLLNNICSDRHQWLETVRNSLSQGIADTCRPTNEVSLWDWGYTVATLTKAAVAYIFKNGWPSDIKNLPFCTLRINLDILEHYTRCDKISDLLGVQEVIKSTFKNVQILLEETYALGNQLYQDETGVYYLLPEIFNDIEKAELRKEIQVLFPSDLRPQVHFSNPITAGELDTDQPRSRELVAEPRKQALNKETISSNNHLYLFQREWSEEARPKNSATCIVCGVRPIGYPVKGSCPELEINLPKWAGENKSRERKVCRVCLERRGRRSEQWVNEDLKHTIWTDEVADNNNRLALFVGNLGLEGWLDGTLLSTIQVTQGNTKNSSPARLYRIAETARAFWKKVTDELMPNAVVQRPFRLEIYPNSDNFSELGDYHAYDLDIDGVVLSIVWDKPNKRFLTTDNLNYFAQKLLDNLDDDLVKILRRKLEGKVFKVIEPSNFFKSSEPKAEITIKKVEITGSYLPAISLLTEPSLCLMLIPADKALELAHQVKKEYEKQMGKVRDRLPLDIGLIFFNRRTPIRSVLEAGRAMLDSSVNFNVDEEASWKEWRLINKNLSGDSYELKFDNDITWNIPVVAGDGNTEDKWYPRLYEGDSWEKKQSTHCSKLAKRNDRMPKNKGKRIWVRPSHFDFEYLDSSARRFEIHYDKEGRRPRKTRPFYLEDLDRFQTLWTILKNLETTQRHQVIYTIEATREMWYGENIQESWTDPVFEQFVTDTLANAAWTKNYKKWTDISPENRQELIKAGVRGELADIADLYMEILKQR